MDDIIYILFVCIFAPLLLMLFAVDEKSRLTIGYVLVGTFVALFSSEVNGLLLRFTDMSNFDFVTTVTPVTEELFKAIPLLFYAVFFSDKKEKILNISIALGIGFAMLENAFVMIKNVEIISPNLALIRGFGTGLMHGVCTYMVGIGITFIRKKKKLFHTGTFALLTTAIIYHSIFNILVQSKYQYTGAIIPILSYVFVMAVFKWKKDKEKSK